MPKLTRVLTSIIEGIGVYICTFAGIIIAQYGTALMRPIEANITLQWTRIAFSAVIAFYLVMEDESKGDEVGRKNNIKRRLSNAFKEGMTWNVIMGIGVEAIRAAG